MEKLPLYISLGFMITALFAGFMLYKASGYSRVLLFILAAWFIVQGAITLTGFYRISTGVPPRFALLILPPVIMILVLFISKKGKAFLDRFDTKTLTLLHVVRLPVELTLYGLYIYRFVPGLMTFEGGNLDILSGLSAPFLYYFGYVKHPIYRRWLLAWNIVCLLLLANIAIRAVLSAPFAFQQFGFGQPNMALFYFPFSWLPGFVVPAVLLAQLINIRKLILTK